MPVLTVSDTQSFYVCSLSSRTITYKGQLSPLQVTHAHDFCGKREKYPNYHAASVRKHGKRQAHTCFFLQGRFGLWERIDSTSTCQVFWAAFFVTVTPRDAWQNVFNTLKVFIFVCSFFLVYVGVFLFVFR